MTVKDSPIAVALYCWCVSVVTLSVIVSTIISAVARERPLRSPPQLLCQILSTPIIKWVLIMSTDQVLYTNFAPSFFLFSLF